MAINKVLVYNGSKGFGGAEKYLISLINGLSSDDIRIILCTINSEHTQYFKQQLSNTDTIEVTHLSGLFEVFMAVKKMRPDIVHLNLPYPSTCFSAALAAKAAGAHVIVGALHSVVPVSSKFPFVGIIKKIMAKTVFLILNKIIVMSKASKSSLERDYRDSIGKIEVVYNGIKTGSSRGIVDIEKKKEALGIRKDTKVIGMLSRLVSGKGHKQLIDAASMVLKERKDVIFMIAGDGPLSGSIKTMVEKKKLSEQFLFLGHRDDIYDVIAAMDLAVLPSLHESFPYVILEYMEMSKPVVATSVGGIPEMINSGENGILVSPEDPEALAKSICELLTDRKRADLMGARAREILDEKFTFEKMIQNTKDLYLRSSNDIKKSH